MGQEKMKETIDLGRWSVAKLFRKFFVPTLLGMLSMSAVTAIDGIFVGRGVGSDGIAAVNIVVPLYMFFTGVGLMLGVGCSVAASVYLSKGKVEAARVNVAHALFFATVVTVVPSALMMIFPETTVRLLGASDALSPMATDYLLWFAPSWFSQLWISIALFIIRLDGAPKLAMACSLITAVINIVLDWLFIFPLGWGVRGAAFATSISLVVGGGVAVCYLLFFARVLRLCAVKPYWKSLRFFFCNIWRQCRVGFSALLAETTLGMLMFMGNHTFMSYLGEDGVGAFGIACYYLPFVFMVGSAIAQSAQPIISFNFGLGDWRRVVAAERIALCVSVVCGLVVMSVFVLFPEILVGVFVAADSEAAHLAIEGFPYFSVAFTFFILNLTVIGYYQSVERMRLAALLALLRGFVFLVPSFISLPQLVGTKGIWLALCLSELLAVAFSAFVYGVRQMERRGFCGWRELRQAD